MTAASNRAYRVDALDNLSHLTQVSALGWSFWRDVECRTAGFPVGLVTGLAHAESAEAADQADTAAEALSECRRRILSELRERLNQVRAELQFLPEGGPERETAYSRFLKLKKMAKKAAKNASSPDFAEWVEAGTLAELNDAEARYEGSVRRFENAFAEARTATRNCAAEIAKNDAFREAVAWQNLAVFRLCMDRPQELGPVSESSYRKSETLIASYLQRYCTKNDTIGFFGPEGWARFADEVDLLGFAPGIRLLATRRIYFEEWAIRAYASRLSENPRLRPWQIPRRMAHLRCDGSRLYFPGGAQMQLSDREATVFSACDGHLCAAEIAAGMCANPFMDFESAEDVYAVMEELVRQHRIDWCFEVRVGDAFPERHLRRQLERIDNKTLRDQALDDISHLERKRVAVARAVGSSRAVADALGQLNEAFETLSEGSATRNHGQTYGARTVVYEDCRRDIDVRLGGGLRSALHGPLDLVLASARWYCHEQAAQMLCALKEAFHQCEAMGPRRGSERSVEFANFWPAAQRVFARAEAAGQSDLQVELIARWKRILPFPDETRSAAFSADELRDKIAEVFAVADCGWAAACHQSADVMIAARDAAAVVANEYTFVLGELHMGLNTLINQSAVNQHPDADALLRALGDDLAAPRIIPLFSREGSQQPIRVQGVTRPGIDIELCFSHDARPLDAEHALAMSSLVVELAGGNLSVCERSGKHRFGVLHVFGELLSTLVMNRFRMFGQAPHIPRVSIDRLVVQRESWRVACGALEFASLDDEALAFRSARRWARRHGMPGRVFVKVPWDLKPFYMDFASPVLLRLLRRQIRGALQRGTTPETLVTFSEMLPLPEETWITDHEGRRFTSELRIVGVHADDRVHDRLHR